VVTCPRRPATVVSVTPPAPPSRPTAHQFELSIVFPAGARIAGYGDGDELARAERAGSLSLTLTAPIGTLAFHVDGDANRCTTYPFSIGLIESGL
jgi:hypothetical protein